jgi:predicted RNA methylase
MSAALFHEDVREKVDMRPEARIKMGYYPTPPSVVYRIRSFLDFPVSNANVLDPCCGEGTAVRNLVDGARVTTYGIELDEYRGGQAKDMLDHILQCG